MERHSATRLVLSAAADGVNVGAVGVALARAAGRPDAHHGKPERARHRVPLFVAHRLADGSARVPVKVQQFIGTCVRCTTVFTAQP